MHDTLNSLICNGRASWCVRCGGPQAKVSTSASEGDAPDAAADTGSGNARISGVHSFKVLSESVNVMLLLFNSQGPVKASPAILELIPPIVQAMQLQWTRSLPPVMRQAYSDLIALQSRVHTSIYQFSAHCVECDHCCLSTFLNRYPLLQLFSLLDPSLLTPFACMLWHLTGLLFSQLRDSRSHGTIV